MDAPGHAIPRDIWCAVHGRTSNHMFECGHLRFRKYYRLHHPGCFGAWCPAFGLQHCVERQCELPGRTRLLNSHDHVHVSKCCTAANSRFVGRHASEYDGVLSESVLTQRSTDALVAIKTLGLQCEGRYSGNAECISGCINASRNSRRDTSLLSSGSVHFFAEFQLCGPS